jgi:hypothetical protein
MARAILRFAALSGDDRKLMGEKVRKRAVILFNPERFAAPTAVSLSRRCGENRRSFLTGVSRFLNRPFG